VCAICLSKGVLYRCEVAKGVIIICCLNCATKYGYKVLEEVEEV